MSIYKVVEVKAKSSKSWEDAVQSTIKKVGKEIKNIKSAYVQDMTVKVQGSKVVQYRCKLKIEYGGKGPADAPKK